MLQSELAKIERRYEVQAAVIPALVAAGLLVSIGALAQGRPVPPPHEMLAAPNKPGWSVDERTGCWVWNREPEPNVSVRWSGACDSDGRATGTGTLEWRFDGKVWLSRYEGELYQGKRHGRGEYIDTRGNRYTGEFQNDREHGQGVWMAARGGPFEGARYEGEYRNGNLYTGKWTFPNGDGYEGDIRNDRMTGHGVYTWANGDRYEGEYRDGKQNGRGVFTSHRGGRYEGEYQNDQPHGRGVYLSANGDRYEGEYDKGDANGHGKLTFANGAQYEGKFRAGMANGHGILTSPFGDRYEGGFRNGFPEGYGEYTAGGKEVSGMWVQGCLNADNERFAIGRSKSECR